MEKIVLFSSMDAALAARKRMARACDPEVFATTYSTPRAWLGELWEAYGAALLRVLREALRSFPPWRRRATHCGRHRAPGALQCA